MALDLGLRPKKNLWLAVPLAVLASFFIALMAACVKMESTRSTPEAIVFWRNLISLILFLPWLGFGPPHTSLIEKIKTKEIKLHLLRSITSFLAVLLYFYSLKFLDLTNATLLFNTMPIFIPIVAYLWQGFVIKHRLYWGIGIAFIGIAFVLKPEGSIFQFASLLALLSGIMGAISLVSLRLGHYSEPPERMLFYLFVICTICPGILTLFSFEENWKHLSVDNIKLLSFIGVFGFLYQIAMTAATKFAPIRLLSPFLYFAVLFTMALDRFIWNQMLSKTSLIGFVLIVLGAILMLVLYPKEDLHIKSK